MWTLLALQLNPLPHQAAEQQWQNKTVITDEVCQLLLMILVSETYVTAADVSGFSPPGSFLMCSVPSCSLLCKTKMKSPSGAAFSKLSVPFYRKFHKVFRGRLYAYLGRE